MAELSVIATLKGVDAGGSAVFEKGAAAVGNFVKASQGASAATQSHASAMGKAFSTLGNAVTAPLGAIGKLVGAVGAGLGVAAGFQVFNSLSAAIGAAGGAAVNFEQAMSGVKAVSGATAPEMKSLSGLALKLGKDTSFSASQAAEGIGELVKGGVSVADIMGGAATAALNLAAAGGVSMGEAATIAANAMSQFNLRGSAMEHVADLVAGAANASTISVSDFNLSLAAVGAVANLAGQSFDSTATAITVLGSAGIKGSDAGTSLKAVLNNLIPTTDTAKNKMRELGLITADGANQFINAQGGMKSMGEIAEILQTQTAGLTESQRLLALELIFGSDGMRAAGILAKEGGEGFEAMGAAMLAAGGAATIARERLNNTAGDIEQLKGSLETLAIVLLGQIAPAFRPAIQAATEFTNRFTQEAQTIIQTAQNMAGAHGIGMLPAVLSAVELRIGEVFGPDAQGTFHAVRAAIETVGQALSGDLVGALERVGVPAATTQQALALVQGAMDGAVAAAGRFRGAAEDIAGALGGAIGWLTQTQDGLVFIGAAAGTAAGALGVWAVSATLAGAAALGTSLGIGAMTAAQWLLNAALTANPIGIVIVALAALAGALIAAYQTNETFRERVDHAWATIKIGAAALGTVVERLPAAWEAFRAGAMRAIQGVIDGMLPLKLASELLLAVQMRDMAGAARAWGQLQEAAKTNFKVVRDEVTAVPPVVERMANDVAGAVDDAASGVEQGTGAIGAALDTLPPSAGDAAAGVATAMSRIPDAVSEQAGPAATAATAVGAGISDALSTGVDPAPVGAATTDAVESAVAQGTAHAQAAAPAVGAAIDVGMAAGVTSEGVSTAAAGAVTTAVATASGTASESAPAVGTALDAGMAAGVTPEGVTAATTGAVTTATTAAKGTAAAQSPSIGASIAAGMAQGIGGGTAAVITAAVRLAQAGIAAARAALDSHSPSGEFEDIGETIPEGLVEGVESGSDDLIGAIETMLAEAQATAEEGVAEYVDTFGSLGDLIGAQYEKTFSVVEAAQNKIENDRSESIRKMYRDEELEGRKFNRQMEDLQNDLAEVMRAPYKKAADRTAAVQKVNERIEQLQTDHGRRLADIATANEDRIGEIEFDAADRLRDAQERQNLERGKALREFQRGVEDLVRDTADKAAEIHAKAEEARTEAFRETAKAIRETTDKAADAIRELNDRRDEAFAIRGRRDVFDIKQDDAARVFSTGREDADLVLRQTEQLADRKLRLEQSAADLSRQRSREDADAEYELQRDLAEDADAEDKAKIQERFDRSRSDLERRRRLDDEERAYKAKEDEQALQAAFKKAQADLAKRRQAEKEERDFRKQQETERRNFEDRLAQEALDKQIDKLETERDERIRTIGEALDEKLRQIDDNENKEREALRKSHEQKLQDLRERFLDKVGPLTEEAMGAFERLFDGIKQRIEDSTAAVASLATALGRAALAQVSSGGGGATWASQPQSVRDMFTAQWGAGAQAQWEREHAAEVGAPQQGRPGPGTNAQGRTSGDTTGLTPGSAEWWAEENFRRNTSGRAAGGLVLAGVGYPVGERGPETFIPWTDGMIAPHGANLGGGDTYNINLDFGGATVLGGDTEKLAKQLAGAIRTELLKHGQRNGGVWPR